MHAIQNKAEVSVHPETLTIMIKREMSASPDQVYDAWTKPEEVSAWWDPGGVPLAGCDIDLREGGTFSFRHAGHMPAFTGVYTIVQQPNLIEFEAMGAQCRLEFRASGSGRETLFILSIMCPSQSVFDTFIKMGVHADTGRSVENLAAFVETAD